MAAACDECGRVEARYASAGIRQSNSFSLFAFPDYAADVGSQTRDSEPARADLAEVLERHQVGLDPARPEAVARRRKTGQRTARENIDELCDPGTFVEYGPIVVAAQRRRRGLDDLIRNTPADGLVTGLATINGNLYGPDKARAVVMSYDYTVLAGTQGHQNHRKKDRMFQIARELRLPLVLFAETIREFFRAVFEIPGSRRD